MTTEAVPPPVEFTVGVKERYNLGNYEFIEVSAEVRYTEANTEGFDPGAYGRDVADALMQPHRKRAEGLLPEESDSFLTAHPALEEN